MSETIKVLGKIQSALKAPKGQTNTFGKYKYRSCEDILEAVKPLLAEHGATLTISDEMVEVGGRVYVKATAAIITPEIKMWEAVSAYAREAESKKGMDEAQITGSASSYARKYALNGLFCIDDTKDADATNDHGKAPQKAAPRKDSTEQLINGASTLNELKAVWDSLSTEQHKQYADIKEARKVELSK